MSDTSRPSPPQARIGIVSWNTADLLDRCLASLPAALSGVEAEIVVVDNNSSDRSVEVARGHGVKTIVNLQNVGYARAMNQALAATSAPVLVALNPDTECAPGTLARLITSVTSDQRVGLVVPCLRNDDGSMQHSVFRFPSIAVALIVTMLPSRFQRGWIADRWWLEGKANLKRDGEIDWAIGAVHVMRASAVGEAPYDERWFMYVEDLDLCWRLAAAGWSRRLDSSVEVTHTGNAAGEQAWGSRRDRKVWDASYDVISRHRGPIYMRVYALTNCVGLTRLIVVSSLRALRTRSQGHLARSYAAALRLHLRVLARGPDLNWATTSTGLAGDQ